MKIITIGDSAVGKTCFLRRFIYDNYTDTQISTVAADYMSKTINVGKQKVLLQIWDTSGQEVFRSIVSSYYKGAVGAIFVFDLKSQISFDNLNLWLHNVKELAEPNCVFILIGNKLDLCPPERHQKSKEKIGSDNTNDENNKEQEQEPGKDDNEKELENLFIAKEKAEEYAKANSMQYFEVSAKTGENVQNAFNALISKIEKNLNDGSYEMVSPDIVDFQNEETEKSSCC